MQPSSVAAERVFFATLNVVRVRVVFSHVLWSVCCGELGGEVFLVKKAWETTDLGAVAIRFL